MADTTIDIVLQLAGDVKEMRAEMRGIIAKVSDLVDSSLIFHEMIEGNGKPGLKQEMRDACAEIAGIKQRHAQEDAKTQVVQTRRWEMGKSIAVLAVGQVFTLAGLALAVYLKLK
jgi:CO/xanthine dehydrogenase Mo-binding subunit